MLESSKGVLRKQNGEDPIEKRKEFGEWKWVEEKGVVKNGAFVKK
jgi:hypothetical protein